MSCSSQVDLADTLKFIDFDKLTANLKFRDQGELSLQAKLPQVEGLPTNLVFGHQVFALAKDRSVVPHGHNNMATAFLILQGHLPRPALRPAGGRRRAHHHPPHDRPHLRRRRALDRLGLQGQRPLVHRHQRAGLHLQHPRHGTSIPTTRTPAASISTPTARSSATTASAPSGSARGEVYKLYG